MNEDTVLSRRDFLKVAVVAAVSLFVREQVPGLQALQRAQQTRLPMRLAGLLTHIESAKVVGAAYLQQRAHEADVRLLLDQITSSPAAGDIALFGGPDRQLHQLLDRMIREDFGADRVVNLRGWILSETEARLCALAGLLS
jgi:hypothetical protein